ncbi:hypothetical protein [Sporosarcina sp. YIM B06819]|uniref:hypothetical protein n=1 Tax=Sporosarcina sp. YIM B06819 TaxID=3081769 RepID=UPI00298C1993|nr:hypothetical protein [Sporosarcina sp. YIM B06819]
MKFVKVLFGIVVVIGVLGFSTYYFGTKIIADQVMDHVAVELNDSGQLNSIKQEIKNDPQLQAFIEEGKNVDSSTLPFQTKDQAVRVLIKKFNVSELQELQSKAQSGLTAAEKQQLLQDIEGKLTDEELLALKVLAYKELSQTK